MGLLLVGVFASVATSADFVGGPATPTLQPVFVNGDLNYSCFAIPALVVTTNGTLLAFAEGRGLRDKPGHR